MRGFVAQALSWSVIEAVLCQCDLLVRDLFEPAMFRKELAEQAIEIFVGAALPGGIWMCKVVAQLQFCRDPLMLRKFLAIIGGQGVRHVCEGLQLPDDRLAHSRRMFTRDARDQRIAALAFVEGDQRL